MTAVLVIAWAVAGGLWRRLLGGWLHLPRWACVASYAALMAPAWFLAPWPAVLFLHAFAALYWLPGHLWTSWGAMVLRYGPWIGTAWYWIANYLPKKWTQPTVAAEFVAAFLYHLVVFAAIASI